MKTLDVHDKNPKEISSLVESFVDTDERPIQIITDYEFYSKRRKVVKEILGREKRQGKMKFYCLFNTPWYYLEDLWLCLNQDKLCVTNCFIIEV